jgi:hypothetical protein
MIDEPKEGSPRYSLVTQPDFSADATLITPDQSKITSKIIRKSNVLRAEFAFPKTFPLKIVEGAPFIVHLQRERAPIVLMPAQKLYAEGPEFLRFSPGAMLQQLFATVASRQSLVLEELGNETVEGHECLKVRIKEEGKPTDLFLWFAKDLKNLVIKVVGQFEGQFFQVSLANVSIDVPEEAIALPQDYETTYKKVDVASLFVQPPNAPPPPAGSSAPAPAQKAP